MSKANYGIDAPHVLRNLFVFGALCVLLVFITPRVLHAGPANFNLHSMFGWTGGFLLAEAFLYLFYVKRGKMQHRDRMLALHAWRGDEQVLDVGTGRGLSLIGAAKRLTAGRAIGIDVWSNVDLGDNSAQATMRNLEIEGVASKCTLVSEGAQAMNFADAKFDVIVSNLCLHNLYDAKLREQALQQISRVLKPGGVAILSDYKRTSEYAKTLAKLGLSVICKPYTLKTFPPLRIVVAHKP